MPRQKKEAVPTLMKLPKSTRRLAEMIGDGDRTAGVERLFAQLPVFHRVKLLLQSMAEDVNVPPQWRELIEAELLGLEELEIDRIHEEAVAEGVIVLKGDSGESTAWII